MDSSASNSEIGLRHASKFANQNRTRILPSSHSDSTKHRSVRNDNSSKPCPDERDDVSSCSSTATTIKRPTVSSNIVPHSKHKHRNRHCTSTSSNNTNTDRSSNNRYSTSSNVCPRCINQRRRKTTIDRIDSQIRILKAEIWRELDSYITQVRAQFVAALQDDQGDQSQSSVQSVSTHISTKEYNSALQSKHTKNNTKSIRQKQ